MIAAYQAKDCCQALLLLATSHDDGGVMPGSQLPFPLLMRRGCIVLVYVQMSANSSLRLVSAFVCAHMRLCVHKHMSYFAHTVTQSN